MTERELELGNQLFKEIISTENKIRDTKRAVEQKNRLVSFLFNMNAFGHSDYAQYKEIVEKVIPIMLEDLETKLSKLRKEFEEL